MEEASGSRSHTVSISQHCYKDLHGKTKLSNMEESLEDVSQNMVQKGFSIASIEGSIKNDDTRDSMTITSSTGVTSSTCSSSGLSTGSSCSDDLSFSSSETRKASPTPSDNDGLSQKHSVEQQSQRLDTRHISISDRPPRKQLTSVEQQSQQLQIYTRHMSVSDRPPRKQPNSDDSSFYTSVEQQSQQLQIDTRHMSISDRQSRKERNSDDSSFSSSELRKRRSPSAHSPVGGEYKHIASRLHSPTAASTARKKSLKASPRSMTVQKLTKVSGKKKSYSHIKSALFSPTYTSTARKLSSPDPPACSKAFMRRNGKSPSPSSPNLQKKRILSPSSTYTSTTGNLSSPDPSTGSKAIMRRTGKSPSPFSPNLQKKRILPPSRNIHLSTGEGIDSPKPGKCSNFEKQSKLVSSNEASTVRKSPLNGRNMGLAKDSSSSRQRTFMKKRDSTKSQSNSFSRSPTRSPARGKRDTPRSKHAYRQDANDNFLHPKQNERNFDSIEDVEQSQALKFLRNCQLSIEAEAINETRARQTSCAFFSSPSSFHRTPHGSQITSEFSASRKQHVSNDIDGKEQDNPEHDSQPPTSLTSITPVILQQRNGTPLREGRKEIPSAVLASSDTLDSSLTRNLIVVPVGRPEERPKRDVDVMKASTHVEESASSHPTTCYSCKDSDYTSELIKYDLEGGSNRSTQLPPSREVQTDSSINTTSQESDGDITLNEYERIHSAIGKSHTHETDLSHISSLIDVYWIERENMGFQEEGVEIVLNEEYEQRQAPTTDKSASNSLSSNEKKILQIPRRDEKEESVNCEREGIRHNNKEQSALQNYDNVKEKVPQHEEELSGISIQIESGVIDTSKAPLQQHISSPICGITDDEVTQVKEDIISDYKEPFHKAVTLLRKEINESRSDTDTLQSMSTVFSKGKNAEIESPLNKRILEIPIIPNTKLGHTPTAPTKREVNATKQSKKCTCDQRGRDQPLYEGKHTIKKNDRNHNHVGCHANEDDSSRNTQTKDHKLTNLGQGDSVGVTNAPEENEDRNDICSVGSCECQLREDEPHRINQDFESMYSQHINEEQMIDQWPKDAKSKDRRARGQIQKARDTGDVELLARICHDYREEFRSARFYITVMMMEKDDLEHKLNVISHAYESMEEELSDSTMENTQLRKSLNKLQKELFEKEEEMQSTFSTMETEMMEGLESAVKKAKRLQKELNLQRSKRRTLESELKKLKLAPA